jgi:hypothetical protein
VRAWFVFVCISECVYVCVCLLCCVYVFVWFVLLCLCVCFGFECVGAHFSARRPSAVRLPPNLNSELSRSADGARLLRDSGIARVLAEKLTDTQSRFSLLEQRAALWSLVRARGATVVVPAVTRMRRVQGHLGSTQRGWAVLIGQVPHAAQLISTMALSASFFSLRG